MFLFAARRFGRMGPLGIAYTGYRLWRRLSPQQKQALRARPTTATPPSEGASVAEPDQAPPGQERDDEGDEPSPAQEAQDEQARQEETGQESPA